MLAGLVSYVYLRLEKAVDENTSHVTELAERVSKLEGSMGILSKLESAGSGVVQSTKLDVAELLSVEGIRFKVRLTHALADDRPVELRDSFSLRNDSKMYVYLEWLDLQGHHRVLVRWIMPDRRVYTENIYDTEFKEASWYTWHWQALYPQMPRGAWFVEILLDGKLLSTKSFRVTS